MIFGHLPAGYITSKLLFNKLEARTGFYKAFMFWGMLGAITPDLDLFYYYMMDVYKTPHHTYPTHLPFFWLILILISILWLRLNNHSQNPAFAFIFSFNGLIHLILDTFTGSIFWLEPLSSTPFSFVSLDLEYNSWGLNYFAHWAFVLELFIIWWALYLRFRKFRRLS